MYNRQEASRIRHEFWTAFGKYMSPILSSEGDKINWVNYHTKLKDVHFRMEAGQKSASIYISLEHQDADIRQLYFDQFQEFTNILHETVGEEWEWQPDVSVDGKTISRIYRELPDTSVFNRSQWPDLITFFKLRIIALDSFWENAKYSFETLK